MTGEDLFFYATINAESESRIWPELSADEKIIWDTAARYAAAQSPLKHGQCCRCPVVDGDPHELVGPAHLFSDSMAAAIEVGQRKLAAVLKTADEFGVITATRLRRVIEETT